MKNKNHLDRFRHNHAHSSIYRPIEINLGIVKHIQELFRHVQNPVKPRHIQDTGTLRTPHIYNSRYVQNPVKYLRWRILFKKYLFYLKKVWAPRGARGREF